MRTNRSALSYARGRNSTALTTLKIAVLAPMPSASVSTATAGKPGFFRNWRGGNFRSLMAQRLHRIDFRCAARGEPAGQEADRGEHHCNSNQRGWIVRLYPEKQCPENMCRCQSDADSQNQSHPDQSKTLAEDQMQDVPSLSADGGPNGDLASARSDRPGPNAADSDQRQSAPRK